MSSQSAKKLANLLGSKRVYPDRNYKPKRNHYTINWGSSSFPDWYQTSTDWAGHLNDISAVSMAADKLRTFGALEGVVPIPMWATTKEVATEWLDQGHKVFCRQTLTGHSGHGIIIASTVEELVDAPLYVQAVKKDKEYRVHVFKGEVIDFQQKKKKQGHEGGTPGIRNHANGWIYARSDVALPDGVVEQSVAAVAALGLDFGAVDICTDYEGKVFVFEVNTAPGLTGSTLTAYAEAIKRLL